MDLNLIKKHLNIDSSFTDDDQYLLMLAEVAEKAVEKHIDNIEMFGNGQEIPLPITQAMLLIIGNMYANREAVAFTNSYEVPLCYQYLLSLYKDYSKKENEGGVFG